MGPPVLVVRRIMRGIVGHDCLIVVDMFGRYGLWIDVLSNGIPGRMRFIRGEGFWVMVEAPAQVMKYRGKRLFLGIFLVCTMCLRRRLVL
jgi:hypothetical protein